MNSDGSVIVNLALTEIGQGCNTAIAQIAAERLRFPIEKVKVAVEKDTDKEPYDWQTVASKGLILSRQRHDARLRRPAQAGVRRRGARCCAPSRRTWTTTRRRSSSSTVRTTR